MTTAEFDQVFEEMNAPEYLAEHVCDQSFVARAGERERNEQDKRINVELIGGEAGRCIGINDYRICGPKPIRGVVVSSWTTTKNDVLRAFLTPDEKHDWLAKELQVFPVEQYAALIEQRERLVEVLSMIVCNGCHNRIGWKETPTKYGDWTKCSSCRAARELLATIEREGEASRCSDV